jgi:hypothetical protein
MDALDRIWKPDHRYLKAGVMLLDLVPGTPTRPCSSAHQAGASANRGA